jgi:virulence-associated protein VapD
MKSKIRRRAFSKLAVVPPHGHNSPWTDHQIRQGTRMYAICFDLDQDALQRHYPGNSPTNGYAEIRAVLAQHGFSWQQGSVYFGDAHVTPVTCVVAVQAVQAAYPWFARSVSDVRMLRIEENNDLMPAIGELDLFNDAIPPIAAAE